MKMPPQARSQAAGSCLFGSPLSKENEYRTTSKMASPPVLRARDPACLSDRANSPIYIHDSLAATTTCEQNVRRVPATNYTQAYVDQLKSYYKKEREEYEERIRSLESTHSSVRESLQSEIDMLKKKIDECQKSYNVHLQENSRASTTKLKELMREKDGLIAELQTKVIILR